MAVPKLLLFASGTKIGGGSGVENLVQAVTCKRLEADIVGFVSNHANGGVQQRAKNLGIDFYHMPGPWDENHYQAVTRRFDSEFNGFSGWLKRVVGLDPCTGFNIHPGLLPYTAGLHSHFVHDKMINGYKAGEVTESAVVMHFMTDEYDRGPKFFDHRIPILPRDTADTLGKRVNRIEHMYQPEVTDLVIHREIRWNGVNPASLEGSLVNISHL